MIFVKPAVKSLQEFAKLIQERSSHELDDAPNTQSLFFSYFCFIWAASELSKVRFFVVYNEKVTQAVIFARNLLKGAQV
jgi:hypothetical protein